MDSFKNRSVAWASSVNEKTGLDHKIEAYKTRNIKFVVADAGYTDFARIQTHAKDNLFLLTPITNAKNAKKLAYLFDCGFGESDELGVCGCFSGLDGLDLGIGLASDGGLGIVHDCLSYLRLSLVLWVCRFFFGIILTSL